MIEAGSSLVLATHNQGKVLEFADLLSPLDITLKSAADFQLVEPVEDGDSFYANAFIKAHFVHKQTGLASLADDSGLVVYAIGGEPGIHSARWAGPEKNFSKAVQQVQDRVLATGKKDWRAAFVASLVLFTETGLSFYAEGRCEGQLRFPPSGAAGFGYDPIFVPDGASRCFAEMTKAEKAQYSHRALATGELLDVLQQTQL